MCGEIIMQKLRADMNIGDNLRALRNKHKYTQEELVAKMGILEIDISRSIYSRYETGELNVPVSVLVVLHKIYNCSYDEFFKGLDVIN